MADDSSPQTVLVVSRRLGRPPVGAEPSSTVSARVPQSLHDDLCRIATQAEMPVGALVRTLLIGLVRHGRVLY